MFKFAIATFVTGALTVGAASIDDGGETRHLDLGDTVPGDIVLTDIDGVEHSFADYRDKVVVLDFWSINCPWSIKYEERFKKLHKDLADNEDVVFLAINANHTELDLDAEDPYGRIRAYAKKADVRFPILIDLDNRFADLLDAKTTPHVYVLDQKGVISYIGAPDDDRNGEKEESARKRYMRDAIHAVHHGEKVEVQRTKAFGCSIKRKKSA